jgi:hypothetical protein
MAEQEYIPCPCCPPPEKKERNWVEEFGDAIGCAERALTVAQEKEKSAG